MHATGTSTSSYTRKRVIPLSCIRDVARTILISWLVWMFLSTSAFAASDGGFECNNPCSASKFRKNAHIQWMTRSEADSALGYSDGPKFQAKDCRFIRSRYICTNSETRANVTDYRMVPELVLSGKCSLCPYDPVAALNALVSRKHGELRKEGHMVFVGDSFVRQLVQTTLCQFEHMIEEHECIRVNTAEQYEEYRRDYYIHLVGKAEPETRPPRYWRSCKDVVACTGYSEGHYQKFYSPRDDWIPQVKDDYMCADDYMHTVLTDSSRFQAHLHFAFRSCNISRYLEREGLKASDVDVVVMNDFCSEQWETNRELYQSDLAEVPIVWYSSMVPSRILNVSPHDSPTLNVSSSKKRKPVRKPHRKMSSCLRGMKQVEFDFAAMTRLRRESYSMNGVYTKPDTHLCVPGPHLDLMQLMLHTIANFDL